jgi:hypothetical protein
MKLHPILLGDRQMRAYGWTVVDNDAVRAILVPAGFGQAVNLVPIDRRLADDALAFPSPAAATIWISGRLGSRAPSRTDPTAQTEPSATWEHGHG